MLKAGQRAPNVTLLDLQGSQVRISDFKGKPLVINFWATWCPPCRAEIPELDAVYREYRDKGLEVLGIDYGEDAETVRAFMKGMDVSYRVVVDPGSEAADRYRVAALPTSFFVDAEGVIQAVHLGGMDRKALQEKLDKILVK
jgi:thiol-disulfide isomerase/thioredoxin